MFNNKFNSSKSDPLVEAVKQAQQDGDLHRQAEAHVNEQFGVYSRKAVVREHLAAYDAALAEAYKTIKEAKPLDPVGKEDPKGDVNNNGIPAKKDKSDQYLLKRRAAIGKAMGKRMEEEMDGLPPSAAAKEAGEKQEKETPSSTPSKTGNAAGSTISNARSATGLKEAIARKRDIAKGGPTAPAEYSEPRHPNPGAITSPSPMVQPLKEAWKKLKEAKKEMKEARKCMGEEFDSFDFTNINEAYANYIAEAINTYGLTEEHPVATVENLHMFNEAYVAAVLAEAEDCECEKAEKYEKAAKKHSKHKKMAKVMKKAKEDAEKASDKKELDEAKKWIQAAIKRPGSLSKKLGVPEEKNIPASKLKVKKGDTAATKKQKVLAKTLKHLARKKAMAEELQIDELSHYDTHFVMKGGKATMGKVTSSKGWSDPGKSENISRRETGAIQSIRNNPVTKQREIVTPSAGPKDEKSTQSFLNKELGRPEAPSTSTATQTPQQRWDASRAATGVSSTTAKAQTTAVQSQPSDQKSTSDFMKSQGIGVSAPTPAPTPAPSAPAPSAPAKPMQNPDQNITKLKESVQVGSNNYRIV